jgi:hypothetical protein
MDLKQYFTERRGIGIMSTSNGAGVVDTALYARPHVLKEDEVAFIMRDRLTHANLQENAHANYLFLENGLGYGGVRLFLTRLDESNDQQLINKMSRRGRNPEEDRAGGERYLVRFRVDRALQLVGAEEILFE